jgi:hypothetical protein
MQVAVAAVAAVAAVGAERATHAFLYLLAPTLRSHSYRPASPTLSLSPSPSA